MAMWLKIFNNDRRMEEFLQNFVPTSKMQLKKTCLWYTHGDIKKAQEMFEYYSKDLNLPDFDPVQPSVFDQVKDNSLGLFNWIKENRDDIINTIQYVSSLIQNKGIIPAVDNPTAEVLPPINEEE